MAALRRLTLHRCVPAVRLCQHLTASVLQAYEVLSSPETRASYNQQLQSALIEAMDDFTGHPYSKWLVGHRLGRAHDLNEDRAVFVVRSPLPHSHPSSSRRQQAALLTACVRAQTSNCNTICCNGCFPERFPRIKLFIGTCYSRDEVNMLPRGISWKHGVCG